MPPVETFHSDMAPEALGPYSQAVRAGNTIYLSGQIGLDAKTGEFAGDDIKAQTEQIFRNMQAVANACGTRLTQTAKLTIYMTDLSGFDTVNKIMEEVFDRPYPARACVAVKALPRHALVEIDAVLHLDQ